MAALVVATWVWAAFDSLFSVSTPKHNIVVSTAWLSAASRQKSTTLTFSNGTHHHLHSFLCEILCPEQGCHPRFDNARVISSMEISDAAL